MVYEIEYCTNERGGFAMDTWEHGEIIDVAIDLDFDLKHGTGVHFKWDYCNVSDEDGNRYTVFPGVEWQKEEQ